MMVYRETKYHSVLIFSSCLRLMVQVVLLKVQYLSQVILLRQAEEGMSYLLGALCFFF